MIERASEVVTQTLVAALMVEALLRLWAVRDPVVRIRMRMVTVLAPLLLAPAFVTLAPFRDEQWFAERWALFSVQRWSAVELFGAPADRWWLGACAAVGALLLLLDVVPYVRRRGARRALRTLSVPATESVMRQVERASARLRMPLPQVWLVRAPSVEFLCSGVRSPRIYVSQGALEKLDDRELEAALSHELAHLARRDVARSWLLFAVRVLQAFNPPVHLTIHAMARDIERRADDTAAPTRPLRLALASALLKTFRAGSGRPLVSALPFLAVFERALEQEVEARCRRLLAPRGEGDPRGWLRVCCTFAAVGAVLFFVT